MDNGKKNMSVTLSEDIISGVCVGQELQDTVDNAVQACKGKLSEEEMMEDNKMLLCIKEEANWLRRDGQPKRGQVRRALESTEIGESMEPMEKMCYKLVYRQMDSMDHSLIARKHMKGFQMVWDSLEDRDRERVTEPNSNMTIAYFICIKYVFMKLCQEQVSGILEMMPNSNWKEQWTRDNIVPKYLEEVPERQVWVAFNNTGVSVNPGDTVVTEKVINIMGKTHYADHQSKPRIC